MISSTRARRSSSRDGGPVDVLVADAGAVGLVGGEEGVELAVGAEAVAFAVASGALDDALPRGRGAQRREIVEGAELGELAIAFVGRGAQVRERGVGVAGAREARGGAQLVVGADGRVERRELDVQARAVRVAGLGVRLLGVGAQAVDVRGVLRGVEAVRRGRAAIAGRDRGEQRQDRHGWSAHETSYRPRTRERAPATSVGAADAPGAATSRGSGPGSGRSSPPDDAIHVERRIVSHEDVMTDAPSLDAAPYVRSTVLTLFPTLVWRTELRDAVRERIMAATEAELARAGAPRDLAPGHSWQSHAALHEAPDLAELVAVILRMAGAVLDFLQVGHDGFAITGCWANVNAPGAAHPIHHHPNNFLSGVCYLRVPDGGDTIQFHDPRAQVRVIRPPVRELTGENTDMVVVRVQPGTVLLFPSWLEHSVPPNRGAEPRVSVSYNLMFTRFAETMAAPLWEPGERSPP